MGFLGEVISLLDGPLPKPETDACDWCAYRARTGRIEISQQNVGTNITAESPVPTCPNCNGPMRLRTGKYGEFWSCMNYPNCRGTRNL